MIYVLSVIMVIVLIRQHSLKKKVHIIEEKLKQFECRGSELPVQEGASHAVNVVIPQKVKVQPVEVKVQASTPQEVKTQIVMPQEIKKQVATQQENKVVLAKKISPKKDIFSVESIITKLGISLLLIGVGFIFKLAYDNGLITEELALSIGALIGFILIYIAYRVRKKERKVLSQVLAGGGIATLYITTFAAYQGYGIIPIVMAFIFMTVITAAAFVIAMTTNSVAMAIIAMLGGLLTPFIIKLDSIGLVGVGIYIYMIALASVLIYVFKRWRSLLLCNIIGTFFVTTWLMESGNLSTQSEFKLVILLVLLWLSYNGMEYGLYIRGKESSKFPQISYILFASVPMITLLQVSRLLDLSDEGWTLIFAVIALIYMGLTALIYEKRGETFVSTLTLSFTGFFMIYAIILYFGGGVQVLAIMSVSLMYYLIANRFTYKVSRILGHVAMGLGSMIAFSDLVTDAMDAQHILFDFIVRVIILLFIIAGALLNKKLAKTIIAIYGFEVFALLLLNIKLSEWFEELELIAVMIVIHGLYTLGLYLISKKTKLLPKMSVFVVALLPYFIRLTMTIVIYYSWEINGYVTGAFVFYSIIIYVLAHLLFAKENLFYLISLKLLSYNMVWLILLSDMAVLSDRFVVGIILSGALVYVIQYVEPHTEHKVVIVYRDILTMLTIVMSLFYASMAEDISKASLLSIVIHIGLLILIYGLLRLLKQYMNMLVMYMIHIGLYMVVTYKLFINFDIGNGTITLLWAGYAIILLTFSVIKSYKSIITLALVMIIVVASKFIIVDLSTVSILWKIIVSMVFGSALLALSYFLQPILSKESSE